MAQGFFLRVYEIVKKIPKGKVATYGQIAKILNAPRTSKQIGWALHANTDPKNIPCHRVVNKFGKMAESYAFGGKDKQKLKLLNEGVIFCNEDTVSLPKSGCKDEDLL